MVYIQPSLSRMLIFTASHEVTATGGTARDGCVRRLLNNEADPGSGKHAIPKTSTSLLIGSVRWVRCKIGSAKATTRRSSVTIQ